MTVPVSIAAYVVFGITTVWWMAPVYAAMADVVAPHRRTTALAIFNLGLTMIGGGLGPLFVGALSDALVPAFGQEALRGALAITMGSYVIGIVAFLAAIRPYATPNEPAPPRG